MRRKHVAAGAAIAAAASLGLTACGSAGHSASTFTLVTQAASKTTAEGNAKLAITLKLVASGQSLTFDGSGVADLRRNLFKLSIPFPASSGVTGSLDELGVGNVIYLRMPAAARSATGGKEWVVIDPAKLKGASASSSSFAQDMTAYLNALPSAGHDITVVGKADVRGVQTTHYRAVIDAAKADKAQGLSQQSIDQYRAQYGTTTLDEDVYLDGQGVVRRLTVGLTPEPRASGPSAETVTMDFFDFGKADTAGITPPPASDTIAFSQTTLGHTSG